MYLILESNKLLLLLLVVKCILKKNLLTVEIFKNPFLKQKNTGPLKIGTQCLNISLTTTTKVWKA